MACEELAFRDAVRVEVSETGHGLVQGSVQVPKLNVSVGQVYAVLILAMIRHHVGALEQESLGSGSAGNAQHIHVRPVLPPPQEIKINHDLPTSTSHVRLGMTGFSKSTKLYTQLRQH